MSEYHKINTIFKRDDKTHKIIPGDYSYPEFEYLADQTWEWTEKVDGTNIRIMWDGETLRFGGRTDNAQIPAFLLQRLQDLFSGPAAERKSIFACKDVVLYGEGYGARIQKGGGNYKPDGVDFVLFDVCVDGNWLERANVDDIAKALGIQSVPVVGCGTLHEAVEVVRSGIRSTWGDFEAEGLVCRPLVELKTRRGARIIAKLKCCDFDRTQTTPKLSADEMAVAKSLGLTAAEYNEIRNA